jgi:hypothetical protein
MLKRSDADSIRNLKDALRSGVKAMKDADIESRVEAYFRENPDYSRDMVHVAALARRFQQEKAGMKAQEPKQSIRL